MNRLSAHKVGRIIAILAENVAAGDARCQARIGTGALDIPDIERTARLRIAMNWLIEEACGALDIAPLDAAGGGAPLDLQQVRAPVLVQVNAA